ncbi:hypothetical protein ACMGDH_12550 [Sphingomonas sp. DT-207]
MPEQSANNSAAAGIAMEGNAAEMIVPQPREAANGAAGAAALNLAPDGLTFVLESGASRHLPFGTPREAVLRAVGATVGEPKSREVDKECAGGPLESMEFEGGLGLSFSEGRFIGWGLSSREDGRYATAAGIGLGSTRQQVEDAIVIEVEQTPLGHEFHSGTLSGLLSSLAPTGQVTALWAGTTCR